MNIIEKFDGEDLDAWESEYADKRHEAISNLQIDTLNELLGDFEAGIVDIITESVLECVVEAGDDSDRVFFQEVRYALRNFIIVESDSKEDKECRAKVEAGELQDCKFEGYERSNYSLYYII